ncbi:hypothetical protein [Bacillus cereus]|uniref:Uncharacterized protein n=1 Tax=Bacillus cereus TaxID=1396 RepID=A0A164QE05_BACCE|nr:hypothetical protein [Bacillus cereus]KZD71180.1 hypothetical protein B4088_0910 [Bacillus cereus]
MNKLTNDKNNKVSPGIELVKGINSKKSIPTHDFEGNAVPKELKYGELYLKSDNDNEILTTTLIHGTSYGALLGIKNDKELIPNKINSSYAVEEGYHDAEEFYGYLFFTNSIGTAIHNSSYATHNLTIKHPLPDGLYFALEIEIPESKLVTDCKEAKDWEESLDLIRSVKVKGNIPISWVKKVLLCHYDLEEVLIKCTLDNLEEVIMQFKDLFLSESAVTKAVDECLEEGELPIMID